MLKENIFLIFGKVIFFKTEVFIKFLINETILNKLNFFSFRKIKLLTS